MSFIAKRYQIMEEIGHGSMGTVYKALDRLSGQQIALKRVAIQHFASSHEAPEHLSKSRLALAHEFSTLVSLRHPHIITVLDYGFDEKQIPFFTMTLLEDAHILSEVTDQNMPLDLLVRFANQILLALYYLHRRGIIHRDLKPANIMVLDGQIKLLDFGLAKTSKVSQKGIGGTLHYMAPEFFKRVRASIQSDLFALGVIIYETVVGHPPYDPEDIMGRMQGIIDPDPLNNHPLEPIILRLLASEPQDRYANALEAIDAICTATNTTLPVETDAIVESFLQTAPFIGREQELQQLNGLLDEAKVGRGSIVLVGGESGVGKSRLIQELRTTALVEGITVLLGQGVDGGGLPFQLWRDALPRLVLSSTLDTTEMNVLKALVPNIETLVDGAEDEVFSENQPISQQRLVFTIVDLLRRQVQPLLIVMEDLQWTIESLEPLKQLAAAIHELPILIIGSYRNDEKPDLPQELGVEQVMTLRRFDAEDVRELSSAMLGDVGTHPEVVDFLQRETEGNAFFLVEVVRALANSAGGLADIGQITLPDHVVAGGIREAMRRRLNQIPEWGQNLLQLAAVAGRKLDFNVLHRIAQTHPLQSHTMDEWVSVCSDYAVFELHEEEWRFAHDKLREFVLGDLEPALRPHLYQEVAEAVETVYGDDDSWASVLFELWQQAQNKEKEMTYLPRVMLYYVRLVGDYEIGRRLGEYGLREMQADDNRKPKILNNLSMIMWRTGDYPQSRRYASQALALAQSLQEGFETAKALHNLATVDYYEGNHHQAIDYYQRGADLNRTLEHTKNLSNDLIMLGWTQCMVGQYQEAVEVINEGIEICREANDVEGVALGQCTMGFALGGLHQYEDAIAYHQESLTFYRTINSPWHLGLNLASLGFIYLEYQVERCIPFFHEALIVSAGQGSLLLEVVAGFAQYFVKLGNLQRAAKIVGAMIYHPAMNGAAQMRLDAFEDDLKQAIGKEQFEEMLVTGRALDFDVMVQMLLDEFADKASL